MSICEDLEVGVDFDYTPAEKGDFYTPPVSEEVELTAVCLGEVNILDILNQVTIDEIVQNVFDSMEQEPEPDDY
jgi:hypothetical protein